MTFRSNLRSTVVGLVKGQSKRPRKKVKKDRRTGFFERLEDRLVLNGIPIAIEDLSYITAVNTAINIGSGNPTLKGNDSDPEGSSLTLSIVANPTNGTISNFSGSAGTLTYTPNTAFTGVDTFTYKANDGTSDSSTVTVAVAVGGHFGPRTNLEEQPTAMAGGCAANTKPVTFSASCLTGDLEYAQTLTPGVQLLYNSGTLPQPIIVLETFLQSTSAVPDEINAKLTFNGTAGTDYSFDTTGLSAGDPLRFALQADATSLATGRYAYTVRLTARFDTTNVTRDYTGYALVVNRGSSSYEFGRGWQLAGPDKLVSGTGGMMLVRSMGDALWFPEDGSGGYLKARGDDSFSGLVQNGGGTFTLTDKHGIKANFSSAGLLTSRVDRNDNTTAYTHTSGLLTQISDPFGRDTDLTYSSGRLASVTDFAGRTASLTYDSGNLVTVTQPDPDGAGSLAAPVWDFTYDGTTHLLTEVEDPLNQDTNFGYGSHERLTSITHEDSTVWELSALQTIGLPTGASGNSLTDANPLGNVEDERNNDWTYRLDRFGRITEWNNPLSHKTLIQRNSVSLPIKLTAADPDAGGSLTSPVTVFGYSSLGNLRYQKNPDNSTRTWTYSTSFNLVLTATDELSRVSEYTYDGDGNLTEITDPADFDTTFTVNGLGLVTSMVTPDPDAGGGLTAAETNYDYDDYGRLETITYDDNSTRIYTYNSADQVIDDEDELGHSATFTYDALGRQTSAIDREDAETVYAYSSLGRVTKVTDALDNETDYEYSNRNFLVTVTQPDPDGAGSLPRPESEFGYDANGNQTSIGEPSYIGAARTLTFDSANRHTATSQTVSGQSIATSYTYDNLGRITRLIDPLNHDTYYEYSNRSWVTKITGHDPVGGDTPAVTQFSYDVAGQRTSITDPRGFVTSYSFDPRGMVSMMTQPDPDGTGPQWAPTTYYNYDNVGRLKSIDDPLCRLTVYAYTNRDFLTSATLPDPDGGGGLSSPVWSFGYDDAGRQTTVTDPLSRVTTTAYDHVGRVTSETQADPDGAGSLTSPVTSYVYDDMGNVTTVTDPREKVTTYAYDDLQRVTSITQPDPDGGGSLTSPMTTYVYNSQTLLAKITDALNHDTTFAYDSLGRKTGVTDHQSNQTAIAYNKVNLVTGVTLPDPDAAGSLTSPVTTYGYDDYNRLTSILDPLSGSTSFTYDKAANVLTVRDPEVNDTSYAYDNIGRLTIETNELDDARSFTYDPASNLTRRADRNGRVIQLVRDNLDRINSEQWYDDGTPVPSLAIATTTEGGPTNEVQRVGFTGFGLGGTFTLSHNGSTTSALSYNASAATVQSALEGLSSIGTGNVSVTKTQNTSNAQEWQVTFQGSKAGTNVPQTAMNSTNVTVFMGSLTEIEATDISGGSFDEVQTVTLSNADGGIFRLAFLGEITPPLDYDATASEVDTALEGLNAIHQVTVTGNAGGPWTVTFTGNHSLLNVARLNGDTANATNGDLMRTISYVYDAADQLTSAFDPDSGYDYTYDNLGRVLTVDNDDTPDVPHVVLTNAYDAASNRTTLSATIGATADFLNTYTYDGLNRLTRVDQTGQGGGNTVAEKRVGFAYNAVGQFTEIARFKDTDGGGANEIATSTYTYDSINRLTGLAYKNDGSNLFTPHSYTYDNLNSSFGNWSLGLGQSADPSVSALATGAVFSGLGRITQMTSADGTSDYIYDATSQLTDTDHSYQTDETYTYDSNGNRTMSGYDTGPNNQLLDDGTYTYEYDGEGNRTRRVKTSDDSSTEYEWDFRNRLIRVTDIDSEEDVTQVVEYTYDVFDRRISRALDTTDPFDLDDAAIERYVHDDLNGVASFDGGNVVLDFIDPDGPEGEDEIAIAKRYLYGNEVDQLLAQEDVAESTSSADRVLWPLVDHLQTVRDLYRNDATSAQHYKYDSFGRVTSGDTSLTRYLFTSRELDCATGLQYNRARWYDCSIGAWTSGDLLGFFAGTSNLSSYVNNFPTNSIDPSGYIPPVLFTPYVGSPLGAMPPITVTTVVPQSFWPNTITAPPTRTTLLQGFTILRSNSMRPAPLASQNMNIVSSHVKVIHYLPLGHLAGPWGCGPCTGVILIPPNPKQPTYILHLDPEANVISAFSGIPLTMPGYTAVINGMNSNARAPRFVLWKVLIQINLRNIPVAGYVPAPTFHVSGFRHLYWTLPGTYTSPENDVP